MSLRRGNFGLYPMDKLLITTSPLHGEGVFAQRDVTKGTIIELCPYIVIDDNDLKKNSRLFDYVFTSPQDENDYLCVLGYGMLYNHSYKPNVEWRILEEDNRFIAFEAIKNIKVGDEIVHDYGKEYWETRKEKVNG